MKIVGASRPVHDAGAKAAGYTAYTADTYLPNMVYAALVYSTVPHGYVRAVHAQKALAMEGVLRVFDGFNTPETAFNRYRSNYDQAALKNEERIFQTHVRFIGDRIACVVATSRETAEKAAKTIEVEYEELPFAVSFEDALAGKNLVGEEKSIRDEFSFEQGTEPERDGLIEVESVCELPRLHHAAMEPHACIASYDPFAQTLTVISPNQSVHGIRTVLSEFLSMPQSHIRVIKAPMGGSFGAKQEWVLEPVTAWIAKEMQRPVRTVMSREETMRSTYVRGAMRSHIRSLFSPDGTLRSLTFDLLMDAGAYIGSSADYIRAFSGKLFRCYRMEHVKFHASLISSNTPVAGAFRGWSSPEEAIMLEHHMDLAAEKLGMDRVALRIMNAERAGEKDKRSGVPLESMQAVKTLAVGAEEFSWNELKKADERFNSSQTRYRRGVGVGCGGHGNTYYPRFKDYAECRAQMNADGTAQICATLHDHGCGTVTAMKMIAAEALCISESSIYMEEGDTAYTPVDFGCFASRTVYVLGRAVQKASETLLGKLLEEAALFWQTGRDNVYAENGAVFDRTVPGRRLSYAELTVRYMHEKQENLTANAQYACKSNPGVGGAHFAHVEVDTYSGATRILDYLAVQDIGQPINEGMCIAQIQGAAQMGCGAALREKMTITPDGKCTDSLARYPLFLAPELPEIRVRLITEGKSGEGPFGAKSIGEVCYVPATPAVCGAVNAALGAHMGTLPLDPDRILTFLAKEDRE